MSGRRIEVLEPGLLTSVQDVAGRPGWRHLGVPVSGAADGFSARLANRLVGNLDDAPLLEATIIGPSLRVAAATLVGLAGAELEATLDGRSLAPGVSRPARPGAELRFGPRRARARAYLAFGGGIRVASVLGSASTDLRSGFGGQSGRALREGDVLELGEPSALARAARLAVPLAGESGSIRVLAGPHADRFAPDVMERLCAADWLVGAEADRAGVRLDGPAMDGAGAPEVPSLPLPLGAVQLPPDGRPIVMLADRPVTGGYPVVACVIRADIGRIAQLVPGEALRFALTTADAAREALRAQERLLDSLEPVAPEVGGDAAWAGSLD